MKMNRKLMIIAISVMMAVTMIPGMAFASTQRAGSGVTMSSAQKAAVMTMAPGYEGGTDYVTFGSKSGGDVTKTAYKYTAPASGIYAFAVASAKSLNGKSPYYSTSKTGTGHKIILKGTAYQKLINMTKGQSYYFYFDSKSVSKTGYLNFAIFKVTNAGVQFVTTDTMMTLPKNNSVTKFAFKPAETGYYMLTGSASAIPTGISVYQEEVKVTSAGKYGIYGGNIAGGNDQEYNLQGNVFSLYLHSAPRHYSGMLKLTKGVTYYYSIYDGNQEVTNLHMKKYDPIEMKIGVSGCKTLMYMDLEDYVYDSKTPKYTSAYSTINKNETLGMAYFPASGKTLKSVTVNGKSADYYTSKAEMYEFDDEGGNAVWNATFTDGKEWLSDEYVSKHQDIAKYMTKGTHNGVEQYYYTLAAEKELNGAASYKVIKTYDFVEINAPKSGWKTGDQLTLTCE